MKLLDFRKNIYMKKIKSVVGEYISPINWLLNVIIGKRRDVEHIWPPQNFSDRNKLLYTVIDKPLAKRGVFLPRHNLKEKISLTRFKTFHEEHIVIDRMLEELGLPYRDAFFVDIGAGDGIDMNNTYLLAAAGADGISLELNSSKFAMMGVTYRDLPQVALGRCAVSPLNVCSLLDGLGAPEQIDVLSLDIDSFDYFVLEALLKKYQIKILCLEINPIFPLEIDFTVNYPNSEWSGGNFQSMSLSMLHKAISPHGYSIVHINKECVFAVPDSIALKEFPVIPLHSLNACLDSSLKDSPADWIIKNYRNKDIDTLIEQISQEFKKYDPSQFYLGKSLLLNSDA